MKPNHGRDWMVHSKGSDNIEAIEAYFAGHAYDLHRHDTYAIGQTFAGVQSFRYRGARRDNLPGSVMVLHPDELHDGHAGSEQGFLYRMVYIEPALIQQVLPGQSLPFIPGGISQDSRLINATHALLGTFDSPLESLEKADALYDLALALNAVSGAATPCGALDYAAAERAREFIHHNLDRAVTVEQLSAHANRDRWGLSRDFRQVFGTSPHRYLIMRRLDRVKQALIGGQTLVEASLTAGFYDQSHMSRHFIQAFGLSANRWKKMISQTI
ncbi:AraC family transcriptional regulator [Acerihabitans sp. TG2]|uniref:AraC family transcriptional regulator n=1 Tax=Acerihabitans sp. TG2 TaxID=3096008 RepID=UPI002B22CB43|nr:AraC family transcriptional regulator [Acerihabitans sp. TG2]MEA9391214.1 AraC family transcriptional regulator [Acerihabitans sp. TG2]